MATAVRLPGLGESISEGAIVAWHKKLGDVVARDDVLCTVSTDKVEAEIPSIEQGVVLALVAPVGATVPVGGVLCVLGAAGEQVPAALLAPSAPKRGAPPPVAPRSAVASKSGGPRDAGSRTRAFRQGGDRKLFVSPVVRRLARERDVDLSAVVGSGEGGRVTRRDLEAFVANGGGGSGFAAPPGGYSPGMSIPFGGFARRVVAPFDPATAARYQPDEDGAEVTPLSGLGRAMAEHMAYTWWRTPHVSTVIELDLLLLSRWRDTHGAAFAAAHGSKPSYTACICWAVARTLANHPDFNSSLTDDLRRVRHAGVHLGVAVARPDGGLLVPVVRDAGGLDLPTFTVALQALVDRARSGKLGSDDLAGGTFTVTNVGSNGNLASFPLINQPQVGIAATGAITKRVVVVTNEAGEDEIAIRPRMFLTLTYDHRAVDGARSGRFLKELRERLEQWTGA